MRVAEFEHLPRPNEKKRALFCSNFKVEVVGLSSGKKRRYGFRGRLEEKFFPQIIDFATLILEPTDVKNLWKKYGLTGNAFMLP